MAESNPINFQPYLQSLVTTYQHWQGRYTLTDVVGRTRLSASSDTANTTPETFDFGLIVQTVTQRNEDESRPEEQKETKEKVERFPVLEGIRKYAGDHVLLIGRPGSGKSTALLRLLLEEAITQGSDASKASDPSRPIPVLVELRYWKSSVLERIQAFLGKHDSTLHLDEDALTKLLHQGRFLLLIDGLNELPSAEARRDVARFAKDFPKNPMIFTTRDLSLGGELGLEKKLEMQPLSEPQMQQFVGNYLGKEQGNRLWQQLQNRLRDLGKTPLLLRMLCELFQQTGIIPKNLGQVFRLFVQGYEGNLKPDVPVRSDRRRWAMILQHLAFEMMQGKQPVDFRRVIPRVEAEKVIVKLIEAKPNEFKADCPVQDYLDDLLNHHLIQPASSSTQIEFRHQLIQEYYAAEALLEQLPDLSDKQLTQDYLNYTKWTEPLALMLALADDQAQALDVVQLAMEEVDLILGARLAGEVSPNFQQQSVSVVNQIINKHELPDWMRVTILGQVQSESSKQILIPYLKHQDVHIVRKAAQFIGEITNPEAVKILSSRLEKVDTKFFSQHSFGGSDKTGHQWTLYIEALSYVNPRKAIDFLRGKLIAPGSEEWRMIIHLSTGAPQLLMNLDGKSVLPILIENLRHLQLKEMRLLQTDTKNEISESQEAISDQRKNEMIFENQKSMIFSLIEYSGDYELVTEDLIQILDLEQNPNSKSQLIRLLRNSSHIDINQVLIRSLTNSGFKVKKEICLQLTERQLKDSDIEDLLNLTKNEDWETAWAAAFVLVNLDHQEPISILAEAMQTNKPKYRSTALPRMTARALSHIDSRIALPILLNVIHENSERDIFFTGIIWEVAFSLSKFGCKEIIPILIEASNSGYLDECKRGIQGLARLGVEDPLRAILKQKLVGWQTAAVELVKIGREEFLPDLCAALVELGSASANEIMQLLSNCADINTIDWLLNALRNPEQYEADLLFPNRVAFVLAHTRSDIFQHRLQDLVSLLLDKHIEQLFWVIPTIQNRCQFYNYEVWQTAMQQQAVAEQKATQGNRQANTVVNIGTFHAPNSAINLGGTVKGDQVGTQEESPNP